MQPELPTFAVLRRVAIARQRPMSTNRRVGRLDRPHVGTPEDGGYGPTACTLVRGEDQAEHVDALSFGVQRPCPGAQTVSELTDLHRVGVNGLEVVGLAARAAQCHRQDCPSLCIEPRSPTMENRSVPGGGSYAQLVTS